MYRSVGNFHAGAGNEPGEGRCDLSSWMLVKRLQYKDAFGENRGQHHDHCLPSVACIKKPSRNAGLLFIVLYQMTNDQICVDQASFTHRLSSRSRAAFVAAPRISLKDIPLPFLLASTPLSKRVPRCTRIVT